MFNDLFVCFECSLPGYPRDEEYFIKELNISSVEGSKGELLNFSLENNLGDFFDFKMNAASISLMYLTLDYIIKMHYGLEKLPDLDFTQGELINCYNNVKRAIEMLNRPPDEEDEDEELLN